MDKNVMEIRREQWFERIRLWSASGLSKSQWCKENDVPLRKFYYWQNRIRQQLYGDIVGKKETAIAVRDGNLPEAAPQELPMSSFAEIPLTPMGTENPNRFHPDMVVKAGGITIELSGGAARNLLESIGEAIRHAV